MQTAGYVLAGGASSRMGRNKAFLRLGDRSLLEIAAAAVREAVGSVTIIGPRDLFQPLGWAVIPDVRPNTGPLGGIETALLHTTADWNLIVACDMPCLTAGTLQRIVEAALADPDAGCVLPEGDQGHLEPLCAMYRKRMLPVITGALAAGTRKVTDALPRQLVRYFPMIADPAFQNINTPEEWSELHRALES